MQCYTDLIPPTGVTSAVSLPFTSATASNIIVAKTSLLQVFSHKTINADSDTKLCLVAEYPISGTITALERVKILKSKSGGEALLVALLDAKLSLVEWDPDKHSISTTSIHYYEDEELQASPWAPRLNQCASRLAVDPDSRCAAFNFGLRNLALLPFHQIGDDLAMDDLDNELDEENGVELSAPKKTNEDAASYQTPYAASFVLPLTTLDTSILHPIDITFLHEFREPAFGILYSTLARSQAMMYERKDVVSYAVFTLDLEQRASTSLSLTQRLPNDLFRVVSLPLPVGGSLLIGSNEIVHVDQGGKTVAIGVNEFARQSSSFSMADQADLALRLERCEVVQLGTPSGDMLLILENGDLCILSFRLDGRTVSGLAVRSLSPDQSLTGSEPSCTTPVGVGMAFIGFEGADSVLLGWGKRASLLKRHSSRIGQAATTTDMDIASDEDDLDDYDDDLYGDADNNNQLHRTQSLDPNSSGGLEFRVLDSLPCLAPIRDFAFGRPLGKRKDDAHKSRIPELELVAASGLGKAGGLAICNRELDPEVMSSSKLPGVKEAWAVRVKAQQLALDFDGQENYQECLIVTSSHDQTEETKLYSLNNGDLEEKIGTEFDIEAGPTIAVGSLASDTRVVQVVKNEIRSYDSNFGLAQIYPIIDEDAGTEAGVSAVSFGDSAVLVIREDSSLILLQADQSGDLDEIDVSGLPDEKWLSGCLYRDRTGIFGGGLVIGLLGVHGTFYVFSLSDVSSPVFSYKALHFLPTRLSEEPLPKHWKETETLAEVLIADLGDQVDQSPYLFIRTHQNELVLYQPFKAPSGLRFSKLSCSLVPHTSEFELTGNSMEIEMDDQKGALHVLHDLDGRSAVLMSGPSQAFVLRSAKGAPHAFGFRSTNATSLGPYHAADCQHGFMFIDDDNLCKAKLPLQTNWSLCDWAIRKVVLGEDISSAAYFDHKSVYALATSRPAEFHLPNDDEWHPEWQEESSTFLPQVEQGSLKLLSPKTWRIIDDYLFSPAERVMCVKTMNLTISEEAQERKDLLVVGTAITKGEDVTARGGIYIFDVVDVVPDPDAPDPSSTNLKLKLIASEDVKGAVTALTPIGSQGFFLAAQGQKCMVRGLKEDLTILPVAFMDMNYYVNVAKELPGTGLALLGDAFKGLWFVSYSEEPYRLKVLGRDDTSQGQLDGILAADFLPDGKDLYIVAIDSDAVLHVLQYDPENPKSSAGTRLLARSSFHLGPGHMPGPMALIPRTPSPSNPAPHALLIGTQSGTLALTTPLPSSAPQSEGIYRRLSTLSALLLSSSLEQPLGMNPRAQRAVETDGIGGRPVLDGEVLRRWVGQSTHVRAGMAERVGGDVGDVRADLEGVGVLGGRVGGLGYL